jgi:hypothetical protein
MGTLLSNPNRVVSGTGEQLPPGAGCYLGLQYGGPQKGILQRNRIATFSPRVE